MVMRHTNRPQAIQTGSHTSSTLVSNTGAPQGCVLSPLLFTLYTHDCDPRHEENGAVFAQMLLPSSARLQTTMRLHIERISTTWQRQRKPTSVKPRS